eukprot:10092081-Alexandrium_andersonii.AAC.1
MGFNKRVPGLDCTPLDDLLSKVRSRNAYHVKAFLLHLSDWVACDRGRSLPAVSAQQCAARVLGHLGRLA